MRSEGLSTSVPAARTDLGIAAPQPRRIQSGVAVLAPTHTPATLRRRPGLLGLWHLLSLDAPTVAALWTWFIAAALHIHLPLGTLLAMAVAVWMLYAADRLLDTRRLVEDPLYTGELELRHRFHHRYRTRFVVGIVVACFALAILIPRLEAQSIRLYLVLGALLAGYFILIHTTGSAHRIPKEFAVGIFFASAVFIPAFARAPEPRFFLTNPALLFALLCSLNCLFIYRWEHAATSSSVRPHRLTRLALDHLLLITALSLAANLLLVLLQPWPSRGMPWIIPCACAVSNGLLLLLHHLRHRLSPLTLRAAADLALLSPILLLPALKR